MDRSTHAPPFSRTVLAADMPAGQNINEGGCLTRLYAGCPLGIHVCDNYLAKNSGYWILPPSLDDGNLQGQATTSRSARHPKGQPTGVRGTSRHALGHDLLSQGLHVRGGERFGFRTPPLCSKDCRIETSGGRDASQAAADHDAQVLGSAWLSGQLVGWLAG